MKPIASKMEIQDLESKNLGFGGKANSSELSHFKPNNKLNKDFTYKNNKILMVISYPDTRLKKELESLKKKGYKVSLIMWERSWPFHLDDDIEVKSLKLNVPVGSIKTLLYFPIWWSFLIFWLSKMRWDALHAVNFDTFFFSILIAKIKRKPVVYDIFDFYGDVMEDLIRPAIVKLDRFTMKFSDVIIIADDSRIHQIGANIDNYIVTVNNTPEEDLFRKKNKNKDDNKKFTIFLGGKITEQRSTELIISAIKDMEDVQLIIKGFCAEEDYIANLLEMTADMENVDMCLDGVPYEEITKNTLNADLTIALYDPNIPNNKYASPNKLFEAMASEIPIIVNENTSMADIVKKENCGIIIPFKNEKALKSAISSLKEDQKLRKKLGYNGRKAFENKYNWTIMEERLINIYDHVLS